MAAGDKELRSYLRDWRTLNPRIRVADEKTCLALLRLEHEGRNRRSFLFRIHSRLNRVRRMRERMSL